MYSPRPPAAARYTEVAIRTATPLQLVVILYEGAIQCLQEAHQHVGRGDIANRVRAINRAVAAISELQASLDFNAGGQIAVQLNSLYAYMKQRLFQANVQQSAELIAEVISLLQNLHSAWAQIASAPNPAPNPAGAPQDVPAVLPGETLERESSHSLNISG